MKKIYPIILLTLICFTGLHAQITLTYNTHALRVGDSHDFIFAQNADEGLSGEKIVWDFSNLKSNNLKLTSHMLNPLQVANSSSVPDINLALEEFGNFFLFNVQNDIIEQYGTISCNTITIYDKPFVKIKYPFTYGDDVYGTYSGIEESPNASVPVSGTYEISGDAYGTLILPGNITIDNVLRVKQTRTIKYENGRVITEITYRWYSYDVRYPLFVIIENISDNKKYCVETAYYAHAADKTKSAPAGISSPSYGIDDIATVPNPYVEKLAINYNLKSSGNVKINMYDMNGKLVKNLLDAIQDQGYHSLTINGNEDGIKPGIYYIMICMNTDRYTQKVVKMK
jgi:hypothetical protein